MIFKRIVLNNFRQYYGEQELAFAAGGERNVTIIHGPTALEKHRCLALSIGVFTMKALKESVP